MEKGQEGKKGKGRNGLEKNTPKQQISGHGSAGCLVNTHPNHNPNPNRRPCLVNNCATTLRKVPIQCCHKRKAFDDLYRRKAVVGRHA